MLDYLFYFISGQLLFSGFRIVAMIIYGVFERRTLIPSASGILINSTQP